MNHVGAIQNGDQPVFEALYHSYHQRFYFYVLKHTASAEMAEEVVQTAFMKLWEKRTDLSGKFPVEVQLARVVRSVMIDALRRKAAERKALNVLRQSTEEAISSDPIVSKQLNEKVAEAIDSLPPECRKIFILSREEGLSYNQIADSLSISPKTVENQISKALKVVRKAAALCTLLLFY
ncbi:MAG: RNA polymerase sigma-70 factor [Candidatus Pseudobacter hemicellulosilyticus]|uniref:RNA polymerase sigma-70 factor n=1 Tax=Candidatus Pseudobacter hemicellulosilyticus TaxID=3121375 RepID=A0AAJ6BI69_9BACT|nr:MAG: RNA polymerase sigma-70 factor [Pseudobacter sp.]